MKKILFALAAVAISQFTNAQNTTSTKSVEPFSLIAKGGVNFSNISTTPNGSVNSANNLSSFQVGLGLDIPLGSSLYLQPSLMYTSKGSKVISGTPSSSNYYESTFNPTYLELPVNLVAKVNIGYNSKMYVGFGPYVAMGIGGTRKINGAALGVKYDYENNIKFSNDDPTTTNNEEGAGYGILRKFDAGLNFNIGFEYNNVIIGYNYGYGLSKINSGGSNNNDENKYRVSTITLGFKL